MGDAWLKANLVSLLDGYGAVSMPTPARAWFVSFFNVVVPIKLTPFKLICSILDPTISVFFVANPGGGGSSLPDHVFVNITKLTCFHVLKFFFRVHFLQIGISSEWPKNLIQLTLFRVHAALAGLVGYRDTRSLSIGIRLCSNNAVFFPDLSFVLPLQGHLSIESTHCASSPISKVGISLSSSCRDKEHSISSYVISNHASRSFIAVAQVLADIDYNCYFSSRLSIEFVNLYVTAPAISLASIAAFYNSLDLVLSDRLHVLLLAASCGTPVVPLVSPDMNHKIRSLFEDLGFADILCSCSPTDTKDSVSIFLAARIQRIHDFPRFLRCERAKLHSQMLDVLDSYFNRC
jgi:hypothetical protein